MRVTKSPEGKVSMVFGLPGYIEVLLISLAASAISVIISKYLSDQGAIKNLKTEMKALNEKVKKAQKEGNTSEMNRYSSELMKTSGKQFQYTMKPMVVSMVMFIGLLMFLGSAYVDLVVPSPINIPFVGNQLGWFHWYILIVIPMSFVFRKLLSVE
jgi:uncharacterized membrane protein (DUF106 family)